MRKTKEEKILIILGKITRFVLFELGGTAMFIWAFNSGLTY